ncbi:MAG: AbrB/MazE/SpoVT family DNA-binding domain-containing protein [Burkholderiaceae bacterium]|nr:AbrB/MazE/SpoVT family DNA-binding domain-containing protein [Burkholderiaceae bacterium]
MTIPPSYAEQNGLEVGARVCLTIEGNELTIRPSRKRKTLAELLAATPLQSARVDGWEEMQPIGAEQ